MRIQSHSTSTHRERPGAEAMLSWNGRSPDNQVMWVGRWKFPKGWTKVWSCERHADELPFARRFTDFSGGDQACLSGNPLELSPWAF